MLIKVGNNDKKAVSFGLLTQYLVVYFNFYYKYDKYRGSQCVSVVPMKSTLLSCKVACLSDVDTGPGIKVLQVQILYQVVTPSLEPECGGISV